MEIKKTVKEDVFPSCLQATSNQLFIKSPAEDLIMLWRLLISSSTSFLILSHPKQSGMCSNKMTFVMLSRGYTLCSRRNTDWSISNLPDTMLTGQWWIGRGSYSQRTPKSTGLDQIERFRGSWMECNTVKFWMGEWWKFLKSWRCQRGENISVGQWPQAYLQKGNQVVSR